MSILDAAGPKGPLRDALAACRELLAWALIFGVAVNLLYLAPSLYMMQIYDRVLRSGGLMTLIFISAILTAALLTLALLESLRSRIMARASARLDRLLAPRLLEVALTADRSGMQIGRQHLRLFDTMRQVISSPALSAVMDLPWMPIYVAVCFMMHTVLGVLVLCGAVILVLVAIRNEQSSRAALAAANAAAPRIYAAQEADAANAEPARAMGMQAALVSRQLVSRDELTSLQLRSQLAGAGYGGLTRFVRLGLQSAALGVGAWLAIEREISPGALIAASILATRALAPLDQIVGSWRQLVEGANAYQKIKAALAPSDAMSERTQLPAPRGALKFERVSARVPDADRLALHDVSFALSAGEIVGVVGPSGAGKSTLARIAANALKPDAGVVRLDGANLSEWDADRLGRYVGYLPQDIGLFAGSVGDNIRRLTPRTDENDEAVDAALVDAAKAAGAHDMILRLPKGYDTMIAAGGKGLSFGQAQRIGLARALFMWPSLVVLDEPNAHLDAEGEAALANAIQALKRRGACVLIVAHRAGVLSGADKLLLLRDGKVEAFGPRDQIAKKLAEGAQSTLQQRLALGGSQ